jgi:hypothetical protein
VDGKRCRPETKDEVNVPGRHLVATEEEVGEFELEAIMVWLPVLRFQIRMTGRRVGRYKISILITDPS